VITHLCPPEDVTAFPLRKKIPQTDEVIRVVEIQGHDFSPCCGTHLGSTGQIGILRILGAEKYKAMTRVSFIAGRRVLRDSRQLRQNGDRISRALKVPVQEIGKAVQDLLDRTTKLERDLNAYQEVAALSSAQALIAGRPCTGGAAGKDCLIVECFPNADMEEVLRIGRAAQKLTGAILVLGSEKEAKFAAFCSAKGADIRPLIRVPMEAQGGRGGGGPSFFQGLFRTPEALKVFLADIME
jgi:alanyl-tRNA synthetase